ncbi:mit family metal ion transporter cora [Liquorilactobacillus oeni DSM 19972]|uniref:Mit family metal ion transporter cora n=1 Tax=Liquorilactobacillus oeni DSM 19972 TaxID=1423777 RepID=A0A0R1MJK4_9LACO|nr:mit family metal ion transporter cora [Liquorilactobacillus oeni DSM 19972]
MAFVRDDLVKIVNTFKHKDQEVSLISIIFKLLLQITSDYFDQIDAINETREELFHYKKTPSGHKIEQLAELNEGLVYLTTAADNNVIAIKQFLIVADSKDNFLQLNPTEKEQLGEVKIVAEECQQMTRISSEVLERISTAYTNIINNNLNNIMNFLTIWSLVLAIPPIISGFYGMNVYLPFAGHSWAWIFSIIISLLPILLLLWILHRFHDL